MNYLLLLILIALLALGIRGVYSVYRKRFFVDSFAAAHPEAIWIYYYGPKTGVLAFREIEHGRGIEFNFNKERRGLLVLPGAIRVQISYHNTLAVQQTAFTQTLAFAAVSGKIYFLQVDEQNHIMRVVAQ